ncbi:FHA domain-containing protein [Paenibacillus mesophilus]|uniref:DUF6382 domain-containing protein n=1 Tax=Paenibacillus mesophilus TaxID=2582849 RepID=UPI00110D287B|nr:DUF6382 domain-containing protein [Paenibacillus mesophilus]TMV50255.1 FHA domain-containing protein [Paenibacillus mesophilus]
MERSLYGFHYDYIRHRGTCLVLSGTDTLRYDDFERIELRMMEANDIPGHLPFESEEIDLNVRLRYDITGKKMLSQWMMAGRISLPAYYRFLLKCAGTIDDSKTYMLREDGYWLHEDFIFVGGDSLDELELLYVPVSAAVAKPQVREQYRELAMRLSACIDHIDGSGFSSLLSALHRDTFEFHHIRKMLSSFLNPDTEKSGISDQHDRYGTGISPFPKTAAAETEARNPAAGWITAGSENAESRPAYEPDPFVPMREDADNFDQRQPASSKAEPLNNRQRMLAGAAAGAGLLLLWSFYPSGASDGAMSVWTGMTILILDVLFVTVLLRPRWLGKGKLQAIARSYQAMEEREMTGLTGYLPVMKKDSVLKAPDREPASLSGSAFDPPQPEDRIIPGAGVSTKPDATTWLRPSDATVLLRPEAYHDQTETAEQPSVSYPELEAHKGGAIERVRLSAERYVIGREKGVVDYVEDAAGVSKLHLEIVREHSDYYAKDLGSKNGTLWNNEPMVPYKWYPMTDGATLQIVNTRFVFNWNRKQ